MAQSNGTVPGVCKAANDCPSVDASAQQTIELPRTKEPRQRASAPSSISSTISDDSSSKAKPRFFDGSYTSNHKTETADAEASADLPRHRLSFFNYTLPAWSAFYNTVLLTCDAVMCILAIFLVFVIRPIDYKTLQSQGESGTLFFVYLFYIVITWIVSLALCLGYERHTMGEGYELYAKVIKASFIFFVALCAIDDLCKSRFSRSMTILIPVFSGLLTLVERWLMRRALHHNRVRGEYAYDTIVVGSPQGIRDTIKRLNLNPALGYKPIAVCPVEETNHGDEKVLISVPFASVTGQESKMRILSFNSHLPETARHLKVQTILIADVATRDSEAMRALSLAAESMGIELAFTATVADLDGASLHLRNDHSMPIFTARLPQYRSSIRVMKRLIDIVLSVLALILSSVPILIMSICIKKEDGGPIFYKQQRVGLYGKTFTIYKMRSMKVDRDEAATRKELSKQFDIDGKLMFKLKDDPRVTKVGSFIRRASLDELPQFFNVLKGDMSVVGPRPPLPEEVASYNTLYSARLLAKPGITGPWQISGRSDLSQQEAEQLDVSYIQNWSFTGDIAILLKTVTAVIRGTGSY